VPRQIKSIYVGLKDTRVRHFAFLFIQFIKAVNISAFKLLYRNRRKIEEFLTNNVLRVVCNHHFYNFSEIIFKSNLVDLLIGNIWLHAGLRSYLEKKNMDILTKSQNIA